MICPTQAIVVALFAISSVSLAEDSETAFRQSDTVTLQQSADARVALDAMTLSLKAVRSGTCRMECRYHYSPNEAGQGKAADAGENLFLAFDKDRDLYRYDDLETQYSGRPDQIVVLPDVILSSPGDWTRTSSSKYHRRNIVRRLRSEVENPYRHDRDPFVTAIAGCVANTMHETHYGLLDRYLDKTLRTATIVAYEQAGPDAVSITIRHESAISKVTVEYQLMLNVAQGYVPVQILMRHNGTASSAWTDPDTTKTMWLLTNGVYVPQKTKVIGTHSKNSELTFTMDWEYVNEPLPATLFSLEAFTPQKGDRIAVAKADQLVVDKIVGIELPKRPVMQPSPTSRGRWFGIILLIHAIVVVVGSIIYFTQKKFRSPK